MNSCKWVWSESSPSGEGTDLSYPNRSFGTSSENVPSICMQCTGIQLVSS